MEVMFEALKAMHELGSMSLLELVELNTKLSQLRDQSGGSLRQQIYEYALRVNEFISLRAQDREEDIRSQQRADPARGVLAQGIQVRGVASSTRFGGG